MFRIRTRLFLTYLILVGITVLAAGLFAGKVIKDSHTEAIRRNMMNEVRMIVSMIEPDIASYDPVSRREYYQERVEKFAALTASRITFNPSRSHCTAAPATKMLPSRA